MKKKVVLIVVLVLLLGVMVVPAMAAGPGDCPYGETHKALATSGATGNRGGEAGHIPGNHYGAAGFCGVGNPGGNSGG